MLSRLALISATFHAFNIATLLVVGRLWRHRYAEEPAIRPRPMQLATDLGVAGLIAVLSALIFGTAVGVTGAEPGGLLSQWFFSELLVLLSLAALVLRRAPGLRLYGLRLLPAVTRSIASTRPLASTGISWVGESSRLRGLTLRP